MPLTIARTTTDGKFQLNQTFDWDTLKKEVTVAMVLKNTSGLSQANVQLARYFDGDLSNDFGDDIYDANADSVWGLDGSYGSGAGHHGLMLTTLSFAQPHSVAIEKYSDWDPLGSSQQRARSCLGIRQIGPTAPGNYVGRITFNLGTIAAGGTKTIIVLYKRF